VNNCRHEPQPIDMEFMEWLGTNGVPFAIIFTKADKLKPIAIGKYVDAYVQQLLDTVWEEAPTHFVTSSMKHTGKEELLAFIADINTRVQKT